MWASIKRYLWDWRIIWLTAPSVAVIIILFRLTGWLQYWEWAVLDRFFLLRPPEPTDPRIVIVAIGDKDIKKLGRWPITDTTLAQLLTRVKQQKPIAIGLDLYRDYPVEPGYEKLVKLFETTPNLIGIERKGGKNDVPVAPPPALAKLGQVGSNDILTDGDGKIRRGFLFFTIPEEDLAIESLGLRLALTYLETKNIKPTAAATNPNYMQLGKGVFPIFEANDGSYVGADPAGYQILLNFRGPAGTIQTVPMTDVLNGNIPPDLLRDRIVFVGPTAESLKDFFLTPFSSASVTSPEKMAGVEIQANIASQVISSALEGRQGIQVWSDSLEYAWIVCWAFVGAILAWMLRSPRWAIAAMVTAEGSLLLGSYLAFAYWSWWIPVIPPSLALILAATVLTGYIANQEREDRQTVMNLFGRHVTPEIAAAIWRERDELLNEGRLPGRKMTATVLFTDLKDFSAITEKTDPETLMLWLNEYMEAMSRLVLEQGGIVDKFIGDSVMAVFGVPIARTTAHAIIEDATRAINCALAMATTLETLNLKWASQGRPTTSMRVGISTGTVVTGSLGGQQRLDYTTIGDSVNVASRLESYDKSLDGGICRILISEETYDLVQAKFSTKLIGTVQLRGREQPTKIYQVLMDTRRDSDYDQP